MLRFKNSIKLLHIKPANNGVSSVSIAVDTSSTGYIGGGKSGNARIDNIINRQSIERNIYIMNIISELFGECSIVPYETYNDYAFGIAVEVIRDYKTLTNEQLTNYISILVSREMSYTDYQLKLSDITKDRVKNDPYFYIMNEAYHIANIEYKNRLFLQDINNLHERIITLTNNQNLCHTRLIADEEIIHHFNVTLNLDYFNYIRYYGVPTDGIFSPSILERIRLNLINDDNYMYFFP